MPMLPVQIPQEDQLEIIFETFQQAVRRFEVLLSQQRYRQAQLRRERDPNVIFQDCAREAPSKLDSLVITNSIHVEQLCPEEVAIELNHDTQILPNVPLVANGTSYPVIHAELDKIWLESLDGLSPGDELLQQRVLCSDQYIMSEFVEQWSARWIKLSHIAPSQWTDIVEFTTRRFRPIQWEIPSWSGSRIRNIASRKKQRAATGPDGVSRADILALSEGSLSCLAEMFNTIEQTGSWPLQLTRGFVNSLFKNKGDGGINSYRPITIFSFLYRTWSTARAHDMMNALKHVFPKSVLGGIPGRLSKEIWFEVSQIIEEAQINSKSMQGLVLDIKRAFNCLPRYPLWNLLHVLGLPDKMLKTWASFVSSQGRMFKIRASVSDPVASCVGYPEGCALSVVAMSLIDMLLDAWISETCGDQAQLYAYVDDWHLTFADAVLFPQLWRSVLSFADAVDLSIDSDKSFLWAAQSLERRMLQEAEFGVVLAARDLGVHHNFCRKSGNKTLTDRIRDLEELWPQVRNSKGSIRQKLKIILQLAWPRALFGLSVVHLGHSHYTKIRSGAMKGLASDRIGSNPVLHLSAQNILLDPECWGLVQNFRDVREVGNIAMMEFALSLIGDPDASVPHNGPASILYTRLKRLGWTLTDNGQVEDSIGTFNLFQIPWEALLHRVALAWPRVMASEVAHRKSMAGIHQADMFSVKQFLNTLGDADKVYALCALDGTLYTDVEKDKDNRGAHSKCCFCNSPDSFFHRIWECDAFSSCRAGFKWTSLLTSLPSCLTCHGWAILPSAWLEYQTMFEQLPEPFFRVDWSYGHKGCLDLFTDGSCIAPRFVRLRVASWAVTQALGGPSSLDHRIVAGGWVRGTVQTAYRGELTAMFHALKAAAAANRPARIWCDNAAVVRRTRWLLSGGIPKRNTPHSDLLLAMRDVIGEADLGVSVTLVKVVSHCDPACATDDIDAWAFWHNMLVDRAATDINWRRPTGFWQQWERAKHALDFHEELHRDIMQVILQVGRFNPKTETGLPSWAPVVQHQQNEGYSDPIPRVLSRHNWEPPVKLIAKYGHENIMSLHTWWNDVVQPQLRQPLPLLWLSGVQLYLDFWFSTGHTGMLSPRHGVWFQTDEQLPDGFHPKLNQRSHMFVNVLVAYLKARQIVVPKRLNRPGSSVIAFWAQCYRLPWDVKRLETIDGSLMSLLKKQAGRPKDLCCEVPVLPNEVKHLFGR